MRRKIKKKNSKNNNCIFYFLCALFVVSCQYNDNEKIFSKVSFEAKGNNDFKKENGKINLKNSVFQSYSFISSEDKRLHGYWGTINDTIYFVNPLFIDGECVVKFPIIVLNNKNKSFILRPSSNCKEVPTIISNYKSEIINERNGIYKIKHINDDSNLINNDYCIFTLSLEQGIIDFEYFHFEGNYRIPWSYALPR